MPFSISSLLKKLGSSSEQSGGEGSRSTGSTFVSSLRIAVALYIYPDPGAWDPLYTAIASHPALQFYIIVNPHNGPGGEVPDANYVSEISRLNSYSNVKLFGYVHTSWSERDMSLVEADISTYGKWSQYEAADIHVQGIFFDEAPTKLGTVRYMREAYAYTKSVFGKTGVVWTNPGVAVDARFFEHADMINTFEDAHANWQTVAKPTGEYVSKATVMIHTHNGGEPQSKEVIDSIADAGYQAVLLTTQSGYVAFSSTWASFIDYVASRGA